MPHALPPRRQSNTHRFAVQIDFRNETMSGVNPKVEWCRERPVIKVGRQLYAPVEPLPRRPGWRRIRAVSLQGIDSYGAGRTTRAALMSCTWMAGMGTCSRVTGVSPGS